MASSIDGQHMCKSYELVSWLTTLQQSDEVIGSITVHRIL